MWLSYIRSWRIRLYAIWIEAWLSQKRMAGELIFLWKSFSSWLIRTISQTVATTTQYSSLANDLDMVACLLDFQEIMESPMKMQKPVLDFLVSTQEPQSAPEKAWSLRCEPLSALEAEKISLGQGFLLDNEANERN